MAEKPLPRKNVAFLEGDIMELADLEVKSVSQEVCCGGAPPRRSNPLERPGYGLKPYVRAFIKDNCADVALVKTELELSDRIGTLLIRLGVGRDAYLVSPGLYGVGCPNADSPVIVTANYKLTFDAVRRELTDSDCWILVLDTCGINVWCAAGKNTFSTEEIVRQVEQTRLSTKVNHRHLIVPQLGATGVAAHKVKEKCGFRVIYGPIKASDLPAFLKNDKQATEEMRTVTFSFWERFVLIPVECYLFSKKIWWIFPLLFVLSGISPSIFSLSQAWERGLLISLGIVVGGIGGTMIVPLLLPWIPGRAFSLKGALVGGVTALLFVWLPATLRIIDGIGLMLVMTAISSYLAMNFTGSTPYTSPSGVEKEMKRAIPLQALALAIGTVLWIAGSFIQGK
jgi:hypothetical protein